MSCFLGCWICGYFAFNASTISLVSSTDKVVCVTYATGVSAAIVKALTSWMFSTRWMPSGAWPMVPSTSGWPRWPIMMIVMPSLRIFITSTCTFVTKGQVASNIFKPRCSASWRTAGETPWALNIKVLPAGTSWSSSTKMAPRALKSFTT